MTTTDETPESATSEEGLWVHFVSAHNVAISSAPNGTVVMSYGMELKNRPRLLIRSIRPQLPCSAFLRLSEESSLGRTRSKAVRRPACSTFPSACRLACRRTRCSCS